MWFWLPYLTLSIDANVQRVSLTLGAIYDSRRPLSVEVIAFCQAVQRTGLHTTWVTQHGRKPSTSLPKVQFHTGNRQRDLAPDRTLTTQRPANADAIPGLAASSGIFS